MSDKIKISELPEALSVEDTDLLAIVQGGETKKATVNLLPGQEIGYTPENVTNKTEVWHTPPNHTRYPTEKLVKDQVDAIFAHISALFPRPLNLIALEDLGNYAYLNSAYDSVKKGDVFIADGISGDPGLVDGDWIIAMDNGVTFSASNYGSIAYWKKVQFGADLTPENIRDALATLTGSDMLSASHIFWSGTKSIRQYITDDIVTAIDARQKKLYVERYIVSSTGDTTVFTITGVKLHPILMLLNRVPYIGKQGQPETVGEFDFSYYHSAGGNTIITTNANFNPLIEFSSGNIVDIIHSIDPTGGITTEPNTTEEPPE
jgi:hypothetical protein